MLASDWCLDRYMTGKAQFAIWGAVFQLSFHSVFKTLVFTCLLRFCRTVRLSYHFLRFHCKKERKSFSKYWIVISKWKTNKPSMLLPKKSFTHDDDLLYRLSLCLNSTAELWHHLFPFTVCKKWFPFISIKLHKETGGLEISQSFSDTYLLKTEFITSITPIPKKEWEFLSNMLLNVLE